MEALDVAHLSAMHRMLLGHLMKSKSFTHAGTIAHVVVRGSNRRRGRSKFTEDCVTAALDQLITAKLVEQYVVEMPVTADNIATLLPDQIQYRGSGFNPVDRFYHLPHVKLTFDGWTIAARLNLDRMYR